MRRHPEPAPDEQYENSSVHGNIRVCGTACIRRYQIPFFKLVHATDFARKRSGLSKKVTKETYIGILDPNHYEVDGGCVSTDSERCSDIPCCLLVPSCSAACFLFLRSRRRWAAVFF